jgi:peptide-methionine (S)-S-oxide reductase
MNRLGLLLVGLFVAGVFISGAIRTRGVNVLTKLPDPTVDESRIEKRTDSEESIVLAGGCFWGLQAVYKHISGVTQVTAGYAGGTVRDPNYEEVSSGTTGHAESVKIVYDPSKVTLGQLLKVFFSVAHNPTQKNRQGPDSGTQYRSAIFTSDQEQQRIAQAYVEQLNAAKVFSGLIVTQVAPLTAFYTAEEYHQNYAEQHPDETYIQCFDLPKVKHLKEEFPELYR